jgi:hypothetical protein
MRNSSLMREADAQAAHQLMEAEQYEAEVVDEARRILAGESIKLPSREHLRVLLAWLDGRHTEREVPSWNGIGNPF